MEAAIWAHHAAKWFNQFFLVSSICHKSVSRAVFALKPLATARVNPRMSNAPCRSARRIPAPPGFRHRGAGIIDSLVGGYHSMWTIVGGEGLHMLAACHIWIWDVSPSTVWLWVKLSINLGVFTTVWPRCVFQCEHQELRSLTQAILWLCTGLMSLMLSWS